MFHDIEENLYHYEATILQDLCNVLGTCSAIPGDDFGVGAAGAEKPDSRSRHGTHNAASIP
jgi:hypothetical protein